MQHQHMPPPQGMYGQPPVQQQPPPPQPYYRGPAPQAPPQNVPPQVKDLGIDSTHQVGAGAALCALSSAVDSSNFNPANVIPGSSINT